MTEKLAIVAITENGLSLANKICQSHPQIARYTLKKYQQENWQGYFENLHTLLKKIFFQYKGIILIMSTGIAVRILAPFIKDKSTDPAVVVMDERNNYAISLLSGHLGGANKLAQELADLTGCQAIITTATDINNMVAIDVLARNWNMAIEPISHIKLFNRALLNGECLNYWIDEGIFIPDNIDKVHNIQKFSREIPGYHVLITHRLFKDSEEQKDNIIFLRPKNLILGIGCKRNYPAELLRTKVFQYFAQANLSIKSINTVATIDLKADETAILSLAEELAVSLQTFNQERITQCIEDNNLEISSFVKKMIGVAGVCESAAILAGDNSKLIVQKTKLDGLTLAISQQDYHVSTHNGNWLC